jgi:hypothetical protein
MRMIGCDLHGSQQSIAMWDRETGEIVERTLQHEGTIVRDFYAGLPPPIVVGRVSKTLDVLCGCAETSLWIEVD